MIMGNTTPARQTEMKFPDPPRGVRALPWRLPIWFYRLGMGWVLGTRFLLLNHTGRKTGQTRQAVLEIIQFNPSEQKYLVASGFGKASHWYQNIKQEPIVDIQIGRKKIQAVAKELDPSLGGQIMLDYAKNNPRAIKALARLIGYEIEHTETGYRTFGENIPIIQFIPWKDQSELEI
jgi:deazaflavin-dependent oxidoreductase (nitroreductase family)